jgi:hypothetical protein
MAAINEETVGSTSEDTVPEQPQPCDADGSRQRVQQRIQSVDDLLEEAVEFVIPGDASEDGVEEVDDGVKEGAEADQNPVDKVKNAIHESVKPIGPQNGAEQAQPGQRGRGTTHTREETAHGAPGARHTTEDAAGSSVHQQVLHGGNDRCGKGGVGGFKGGRLCKKILHCAQHALDRREGGGSSARTRLEASCIGGGGSEGEARKGDREKESAGEEHIVEGTEEERSGSSSG